jgi:hypothetical protein
VTDYTTTMDEMRERCVDPDEMRAEVCERAEAEFDRWLAEVERAAAEKAWSEGHAQAMANVAWPGQRKSNPYRKETP